MIGPLGNLMFKLHIVVNVNFPRATYHTIVPSKEELCCLNNVGLNFFFNWIS